MARSTAHNVRRLRLVQQHRWRLGYAQAATIACQRLENFICCTIRDGSSQRLFNLTRSVEGREKRSNRISNWQTYGLYSSLCLATIYLSFSVWDAGCSCSCSSSGHLRYAGPLGSVSPAPRRLPPKQQHSVRISPITARTAGTTGTHQHRQQQQEV